jgi:hypothetical protein
MKILTLLRHLVCRLSNAEYKIHGIAAHIAVRLGGKKSFVTPIIPVMEGDAYDGKAFGVYLHALSTWIRRLEKIGFRILPFKKVSTELKNALAIFVLKSSLAGKALDAMSPEQLERLYLNNASVAQYVNQPFDRVLTNVDVKMIHEENLTLTLGSFFPVLQKKVRELRAGGSANNAKVLRVLALLRKDPKLTITVPMGDGQAYISPSSPIWDLSPEEVRGMGRGAVNALKINGWLKGKPFVNMKAVLVRLSVHEWNALCAKHKIDPGYCGIVLNQHGLKDKAGINPDKSSMLKFNVGYHNDNRAFENKTQVFGNQAYRRSTNLVDPMRYTKAVGSLIEDINDKINDRDVTGLMGVFSGASKVLEGTPYHGNVMNLVSRGLPMPLVRNIDTVLRNMVIKRLGRPKISGSTRTLPRCDASLGILECRLTYAQAKRLGVKVGDTIVILRSPKACGFPLFTAKVVSIGAASFSISPFVYTIFCQGDFDGDTIALFKNEGIVEAEHSLVATLEILFQEEDAAFADTLTHAIDIAWEETDKIDVSGLHPIVQSQYQAIRADRSTGPYDNLATSFQKGGASNSKLRSFWNRVTQVCVTNMKHIGKPIPEASILKKALESLGVRFGQLEDIHYLLNGNEEMYLHPKMTKTKNPSGLSVIRKFEGLDYKGLVASQGKYLENFMVEAQKELSRISMIVKKGNLIDKIFAMTEKGKVQRWNGTGNVLFLRDSIFYTTLGNRDRTETLSATFARLADGIRNLCGDDPDLFGAVWKMMYLLAITETKGHQRWLLTNTVSEEMDISLADMIGQIAKRSGFEPVELCEENDEE